MLFATPSPAWCISTGRLNLFSSPGKVFLEIDYHRVIIDVSFKSFSCRCLCVLKHTCVWPRLGYDKEEVLLACAGKKLVLIFPHSHWFSAQHTARRLYFDFRPNLQFWSSHAFLTLFQCSRGKPALIIFHVSAWKSETDEGTQNLTRVHRIWRVLNLFDIPWVCNISCDTLWK